MSARRAGMGVLMASVLLGVACAPGRDHAAERAVLRATMVELFVRREQPRAITVWDDPREQAPTLAAFGAPFDHHDTLSLQVVDSTGLALPFAVEHTTLGDMNRFFREHPKGWDAWFGARPGNGGVVEVTRPRMFGDSAIMVVGRACGEICRSAWRVTLERNGSASTAGAWRVRSVQILALPR